MNIFVVLKLIFILHSFNNNNNVYYGLIKPKSATLVLHIEDYTMNMNTNQTSFILFYFIFIEEY